MLLLLAIWQQKLAALLRCFAGGSDGERHQAAVAEARRHLGGGGKRGWLA